jgi:glycogen debranching enzyme
VVTSRGIQASAWELFKDAVFGRDSLETAEDLIEVRPDVAVLAIMSLAPLQGTSTNRLTEEEPGRIHHEWRSLHVDGRRVGPMQEKILKELSPKWGGTDEEIIYYGTVDATPLYARLIADYCARYGPSLLNRKFVHYRTKETRTVRDSVVDALNWIERRINSSDLGLVEFCRTNPAGHHFQVWQDGATAYLHSNGKYPNINAPMATVEVQGLAYDALVKGAKLLAHELPKESRRWVEMAQALQSATIVQFWMPQVGFFASMIDRDFNGRPRQLEVLKASPGELLDSNLFDTLHDAQRREFISAIVRRLFSEEFLTPVGLRSRSLDWDHLVPYADYQGSRVTWVKQTYDVAKGLRRQGIFRLAEDLETRILNLVNVTGALVELAYIDPNNRVAYDPQQLRLFKGEREAVIGTNIPEHVQAWTASAIFAIQANWRRRLDREVMGEIMPAQLLETPAQMEEAFPKDYAFVIDTEAGRQAEHEFRNRAGYPEF